ncbi:hypothetical protein [Novosphingobium sp. 18050]|nr:hypothetical protein [Novosphingobium sp. 18050]
MLPYDGSPGGNALGMQFDEDRRRHYEEANDALLEQTDVHPTPLNLLVFLFGAGVFLFVMLYGTVG